MANEPFFNEIKRASESEDFLALIQATEDARKAQRHTERAMRFLVYLLVDFDPKKDVEEYIDDGIIEIAESNRYRQALRTFDETCSLIRKSVGDDSLKRVNDGSRKVSWV